MARIIVFEGIERCSKSSMIDMLHGRFGVKMDPGKKQPDGIQYEDLGVLYEGMHQFAMKFFKLVQDSFLIDRFFLSEMAYAEQFDRKTYMTLDYVQELCDDNEVIMFFMKNTHQDYLDRGPKNKIKLSADDYENMTSIFYKHLNLIRDNVKNITIHEIETSNKTLEEIYINIAQILDEK